MKYDEFVKIGDILKPHGINGELKIFPCNDDLSRFNGYNELFLCKDDVKEPHAVKNVRYHQKFALIKFTDISDYNAAQKYSGWFVEIPLERLPDLPKGSYYYFQIQGCCVVCQDRTKIGTIVSVYNYPANDVYTVQTNNGKMIDIPAIQNAILKIDIENKTICVNKDYLAEILE